MEERLIQVTAMCAYNGHNVGNNGNINLRLKARYSELINCIKLIQVLSNDITVKVKLLQENKPFMLGVWRLKTLSVDHDGECKITLNSMSDFVEVDNLNRIMPTVQGEEFKANFSANVEIEIE